MNVKSVSAYSPLRVSFAGGGTDIDPFLSRFGTVLVTTTIDRGVYVSYKVDEQPLEISSRDKVRTIIYGGNEEETFQEKIISFLDEYGIKKGRLYLNGEVPPGSGLGSSSAMMTALIRVVMEIRGEYENPEKLAKEAYRIEKDKFGITLGIQDPFTIALGGFKKMESNGVDSHFTFYNDSEIMKKLHTGMLICFTGNTRESSDALREQVQGAEKGNRDVISKLKEMKELAKQTAKSVEENDWANFNSLVNHGWEIKKSISSKITGKNVNNIIKTALDSGASSARLLGGGSEGFVLALCQEENIWEVQQALKKISGFVLRVSPVERGTNLFSF